LAEWHCCKHVVGLVAATHGFIVARGSQDADISRTRNESHGPHTQRQTAPSQPVERLEDLRFLRGRGQYVDDVPSPNALHAAILRSSVPHGRVRSIDASARGSFAASMPSSRRPRSATSGHHHAAGASAGSSSRSSSR